MASEGKVPLRTRPEAAAACVTLSLDKAAGPGIVKVDGPFKCLAVVRENHAALARVQVLAGLKAERPDVSNCAEANVVPLGAMRVRGVFDDFEPVLRGNFKNRLHVTCDTSKVNWHYHGCSIGYRRLDS